MIEFNEKIDAEFKQFGFQNGKEIFSTADLLFDFKYMYAVVPVRDSWILGYDRVNFMFVLTNPTKEWPHYIHMIRATTGRERDFPNEEDRTTLYSSYLNPPLSTKDEMIQKIHSIGRGQQMKYKEAYKMLMLGKIDRLNRKKLRNGPK